MLSVFFWGGVVLFFVFSAYFVCDHKITVICMIVQIVEHLHNLWKKLCVNDMLKLKAKETIITPSNHHHSSSTHIYKHFQIWTKNYIPVYFIAIPCNLSLQSKCSSDDGHAGHHPRTPAWDGGPRSFPVQATINILKGVFCYGVVRGSFYYILKTWCWEEPEGFEKRSQLTEGV